MTHRTSKVVCTQGEPSKAPLVLVSFLCLWGLAACASEGAELDAPSELEVARVLSGTGRVRPLAVAGTEDGTLFLVASVAGRLLVDRPSSTAGSTPWIVEDVPGGSDTLMLARFELDGSATWVRSIALGDSALAQVQLAVDPSGGPVLAGTLLGRPIDLGFGPLPGPGRVFVARYGPDGRLVTARRWGGDGAQTVNGIAVGPLGEIWISGRFSQFTGPADQRPVLAEGLRDDAFVLALSRDLEFRWWRSFPNAGFATATAVALGPESGAMALRYEGPMSGPHQQGAQLLTVNKMGAVRDAVDLVDSEGAALVLELVMEPSGGWAGVGTFEGQLTGPQSLRARGTEGFAIRWEEGPELTRVGGPGNDQLRTLDIDELERVWITGTAEGRLDLAPRDLEIRSERAPFLARVDRDGAIRWARVLESEGSTAPYPAGLTAHRLGVWWVLGFKDRTYMGATEFEAPEEAVLLLRFGPT